MLAKRLAVPIAQSATTAPIAIPEKSIAVLPFLDMSEKKDQDYFSDGLAEELLDLLSQVSDLSVAARTSSFYFKGKSEDLATIAQKLRVAHILEGSVRKAGNRIRVTVQLIRAENGYHLWSKTYDRGVEDIFKVQDEIAAAVVEALKARLLPTQQVVNQHRTDNLDAYAQYLLGNQLRARDTTDSNQQALIAYRRAVELDPGYAAAYSGLAVSEWRVADLTTGEVAAYQRAAAAADKAIALAPASPAGYWARGTLRYLNSFDWNGAKADFEKALALDANDVRTLVSYGRLQATLKRIPEALSLTRRALALDPLSAEAWDWMGYYFLCSGQLTEARDAVAHRGSKDASYNGTDWMIELIASEPRTALTLAERGFREIALFGTALAEHSLGHVAESQRALDVLTRERADTWAYQIAEAHAWRGERDQAFEWLERSYRQQDAGLTRLAIDPLLKSLHGDRRFKAMLRRMNLPD
jgi:TolB-like protein